MNSLLRNLLYSLCSKRIDESCIPSTRIRIRKEDLRYFSLSTNTIVSFEQSGQLYYFRECPKVLPFREYCAYEVERFFIGLKRQGINKEHFKQEIPIEIYFTDKVILEFKNEIEERMQQENFFSTMAELDYVAKKQGFSIWEKQNYNAEFLECLGFAHIEPDLLDIAVFFLWYMRSVASAYRTLRIVRGDQYSYFQAVRSVASAIVAEELGLSSLIADARFCTLETEDGEMFGVVSTAVPGGRMVDTSMLPNGSLQRELLALHALDVIMHQPDHGPNNYNVFYDEEHCRICAFDNDNPQTFYPFFSVRRLLAGCSPLIDDCGMFFRPFFDRNIAEKLQNADIKRLEKRLKPYLNGLQIAALVVRLKKLVRAINKTQKRRQLLLATMEFNQDTVLVEIGGKYGITYLSKALRKT